MSHHPEPQAVHSKKRMTVSSRGPPQLRRFLKCLQNLSLREQSLLPMLDLSVSSCKHSHRKRLPFQKSTQNWLICLQNLFEIDEIMLDSCSNLKS